MARRWVANASPLILLGKIAQIHLLPNLAQALVIPAGVASEVDAGPDTDPARQWLSGPGRTYVRETGPVEPVIRRQTGRQSSDVRRDVRRDVARKVRYLWGTPAGPPGCGGFPASPTEHSGMPTGSLRAAEGASYGAAMSLHCPKDLTQTFHRRARKDRRGPSGFNRLGPGPGTKCAGQRHVSSPAVAVHMGGFLCGLGALCGSRALSGFRAVP